MTRARDVANVLSTATALATDTETAAAISTHNSVTTSVHGITNTATLATQTYADSAVSTHSAAADPHSVYLKESEFVAAGKNLVINGGFDFWQRGTSLSLTSGQVYLPDRFKATCRNGAGTQSRYSLTLSESATCANLKYAYQFDITTGATNTNPRIYHVLEDAFYYYGRTMTVSFYAKASKSITVGASADLIFNNADNTSSVSNASLTTSWQRFNYTFTLSPSGTYNSATDYGLILLWDTPMNDTYTVYITGVQIENGPTVTPFSRSGGNLQAELAACQRYYWRRSATGKSTLGTGVTEDSTRAWIAFSFPTEMRAVPTVVEWSGLTVTDGVAYTENVTSINAATLSANKSSGRITFTTAGNLVQNRVAIGETAPAGGHFALGAEL